MKFKITVQFNDGSAQVVQETQVGLPATAVLEKAQCKIDAWRMCGGFYHKSGDDQTYYPWHSIKAIRLEYLYKA